MKKNSSGDNRSGERLSLRHVDQALAGIESISAHIHRVRLSAKVASAEVYSVLGAGKVYLANENQSHFMPQYNKSSYHIYNGFPVTLYTDPKNGFWPKCMIYFKNHNQQTLYKLSKTIPEIKVSSAEYAIDLFCKNQSLVSQLFYVLRRYLYFPNRGRTSTIGGDFSGIDVDRKTNCAYFVWQRVNLPLLVPVES